ncbi:MAG: isochorismatase family protein [Usitatibacter sp.]
MKVRLQRGDLLLVIDVQVDFVSGALAVPDAQSVIPVINRYIREFEQRGLPVVATRDWHPLGHVSFRERGGPWPPHCVQGLPGAEFAPGLMLDPQAHVVSKATEADRDAYSAFDRTELDLWLRRNHVRRLFACGLATDYCVLSSVLDATRLGYVVYLLADAIRAVNVNAGDGLKAVHAMQRGGAVAIEHHDLDCEEPVDG